MQDEVDGTFVLHVINELFQVPTLFPISFASKIMFECYRKWAYVSDHVDFLYAFRLSKNLIVGYWTMQPETPRKRTRSRLVFILPYSYIPPTIVWRLHSRSNGKATTKLYENIAYLCWEQREQICARRLELGLKKVSASGLPCNEKPCILTLLLILRELPGEQSSRIPYLSIANE